MILLRWWKAQQLCNGIGSSLMNSKTNGHLYGFQIQFAVLMPVVENSLELLL